MRIRSPRCRSLLAGDGQLRRPTRASTLLQFLCVAASATEWPVHAQNFPTPSAPVQLAPEIVTASRTPEPREHAASTVRVFDDTDVRSTPALMLDGALRTV